jgi:hypothetical protein
MTMVRDGDVHRAPAVVDVCRADHPGRRGPDDDDDDIDAGDCRRPLPPLLPLLPLLPLRRDSKTTRPRGGGGDVRPYDLVPIRTVYPSHDPPSDCPSENASSDPSNNQSEICRAIQARTRAVGRHGKGGRHMPMSRAAVLAVAEKEKAR